MGQTLVKVAAVPADRVRVRDEMGAQLAAFAAGSWSDADCQWLATHIWSYLEDRTVMLADPEVSATKNAAECARWPQEA